MRTVRHLKSCGALKPNFGTTPALMVKSPRSRWRRGSPYNWTGGRIFGPDPSAVWSPVRSLLAAPPPSQTSCDGFLTGEASFHRAIDAEAAGIALVLVGHYASERFALELLADDLRAAFAGVEAWASRREQDPLRHV